MVAGRSGFFFPRVLVTKRGSLAVPKIMSDGNGPIRISLENAPDDRASLRGATLKRVRG